MDLDGFGFDEDADAGANVGRVSNEDEDFGF